MLLHWLNRPAGSEHWISASALKRSKDRVLQIISDMRSLQELTKHVVVTNGTSSVVRIGDPVRLNRMLAQYTSAPRVFASEPFLPKDGRRWVLGKYILSKRPDEELAAVEAIVLLAERNRLDRLQPCKCGLWYYAKFAHQHFCSSKCRVKYWENSDERKARKRALAKEYYAYHKVHDRR